MPPRRRGPASKPLSAIAQVYSYPTRVGINEIDHSQLKKYDAKEWKSGLTPISLPSGANARQMKKFKKLELYQRHRFWGFTAAELHACESLAPLSNLSSRYIDQPIVNSGIDLHPILRKENWTHDLPLQQAKFPFPFGAPDEDLYWEADTPQVWEALRPALHVASQVLDEINSWQWWNTLLYGQYEDIPDEDFSDGYRRDPPHKRLKDIRGLIPGPRRVLDREIDLLSRNISFHLRAGALNIDTGLSQWWSNAITDAPIGEHVNIWLSYELIAPLFDSRITDSERMLCYFAMAATILHEIAHAVWYRIRKDPHRGGPGEPYWKTDCWVELGLSLELEIFGALTSGQEFNQPHIRTGKGLPNAGYFQLPMHKIAAETMTFKGDYPILNTAETDPESEWILPVVYPVPLTYFFCLQDYCFWTLNVRCKGVKAIHLGPKTEGRRWKGSKFSNEWTTITNANVAFEELAYSPCDTPEERAYLEWENARRCKSEAIRDAVLLGDDSSSNLSTNSATTEPESQATTNDDDAASTANVMDVNFKTFNDILALLRIHRHELALDTMQHWYMAEHVFRAHLNRLGLGIRFKELRNFLNTCQKWGPSERRYFHVQGIQAEGPLYPLASYRTLSFLPDIPGDETWAWENPVLPDRVFVEPTQMEVDWFDYCTTEVMRPGGKWSVFNLDDQWDFDLEIFRNVVSTAAPILRQELLAGGWYVDDIPFTEDLFSRCIAHFDKLKTKWTFGPPGIIRKLPDADYVDPKKPVVEEPEQIMGKRRKREDSEEVNVKKGKRVRAIDCRVPGIQGEEADEQDVEMEDAPYTGTAVNLQRFASNASVNTK